MREMRDSGIEWIGSIPNEWKIKRIKELFYEVNERSEKNDDYQLLAVSEYYGVAPKAEKVDEGDFLTHADSLEGYKICKPDDIVMNIMLAWKRALGVSRYEGIISPAYCIYRKRTNEIDTGYYHYLYRTDLYAGLFKQYSTGIIDSRLRLYPDKFLSLKCQMPELKEQKRMVEYLDSKCAQIDSIIAKQEQIIEKLKEYKLSVITEAVTKGLNPDVEMKDSGIDLCEEIPAHWAISQNRYLLSLRNEKNYKPLEKVQLLSLYTDLGVFPHGEQEERGNKAVKAEGYKVVYRDDIVVNIILAWMGAIGRSAYDGVTSPAYDIYAPEKDVCSRYYHYLYRTKAFSGECYKYGRGIMDMRWRTYSSEFKSIKVPVPPIEEQLIIAEYLDNKCSLIDKTIEDRRTAIDKLEEYKKSLVYEVVTGKKEV